MSGLVRPDGRRFAREPGGEPGAHATAPEGQDVYLVPKRKCDEPQPFPGHATAPQSQDVYLVPERKCDEPQPFLHLDDVRSGRVRLLDDGLRHP